MPSADTGRALPGPHLLGLSLRLVLRALKLSFSGVSSKDRRTLERRPWQSKADLAAGRVDWLPCLLPLQAWDTVSTAPDAAHLSLP